MRAIRKSGSRLICWMLSAFIALSFGLGSCKDDKGVDSEALPFDPKAEIPHGEMNLSLLEQLARSTGGEINPKWREKAGKVQVVRASQPFRARLIFLALALFLLEIIARRVLSAGLFSPANGFFD